MLHKLKSKRSGKVGGAKSYKHTEPRSLNWTLTWVVLTFVLKNFRIGKSYLSNHTLQIEFYLYCYTPRVCIQNYCDLCFCFVSLLF